MSKRQERRRAAREAAKQDKPFVQDGQTITLQNPVSQHFKSFIFGNATHCDHVCTEDSARGQHLVLCGAGPSLADHAAEFCPGADQIWGCNSALTWLIDHGHNPTHGFTVDQTAEMLNEWATAPDVEYLLATSVHPHLTEFLLEKGRRLRWFHNYVGIKERPVSYDGETMSYEDWMYSALFPATVRVGSGLNSVNRAVDLALYMGFERITVLGADCALKVNSRPPDVPHGSPEHMRWLREETIMHADGGSALASNASAVTLGGEIDGRYWESKPDMLISAVWLAKFEQRHRGRLVLVGDTLPAALADKDEDFLARMPAMVDGNGNALAI